MVVKFFSNKKGGSSKAINYLLNHREQEGTARVLKGDPELTRQIINNIKFKQKTTVGCLSFEEKNISEDMKYQLMKDFENHLLPGMENRYNILWVEHTDKGRLELNFVIPKIDLQTQKSLNPYYHKADLPRVEKWQDLQNLKYNYSSPKDPTKERNVEINSHIKKFNESYEQLNENIQELVQKGQLQNREQLIELLKNSGIEVTRTGKDYISVKMPDSKKARKFKGGIYEQQFTSLREIETISQTAEQRVKQYNSRDTRKEQQRLTRELESYTRQKEQKLREIYPSTRGRTKEEYIEPNIDSNKITHQQTTKHRENDREQTRGGEQTQNHINSNINIHSNNSNNSDNSLSNNKQTVPSRDTQNSILLHNQPQREREVNDRTSTTTDARKGTRESIEYRAYIEAENTRNGVLNTITTNANSIRKESISSSRELPINITDNRERLQDLFRAEQEGIRELTGRARQLVQTSKDNERNLNKFTKLREFGNGLKKAINSTRQLIKNKFNSMIDYYNKKFIYESKPLIKAVKELQSKYKYLGSETTLKEIKELEKTFDYEKARDTKHHQEQIKLKELEKTFDEIKIDTIKIKQHQKQPQQEQSWGLHR